MISATSPTSKLAPMKTVTSAAKTKSMGLQFQAMTG
jgi:hypothetical protein